LPQYFLFWPDDTGLKTFTNILLVQKWFLIRQEATRVTTVKTKQSLSPAALSNYKKRRLNKLFSQLKINIAFLKLAWFENIEPHFILIKEMLNYLHGDIKFKIRDFVSLNKKPKFWMIF
jgi:hypothetical protein